MTDVVVEVEEDDGELNRSFWFLGPEMRSVWCGVETGFAKVGLCRFLGIEC